MVDLFRHRRRAGQPAIADAEDPGRLARISYTYMHLPIVAGIVVAAVADELVLAHPAGHLEPAATAVLLGGPALYLLGNALFKWTIAGRLPLSHPVGLALLALLVPLAPALSPSALAAATTAAQIVSHLGARPVASGQHRVQFGRGEIVSTV